MSVIANRYLSALGKSLCSLCVIVLLSTVAGCGEKQSPTLPEEKFQQIYGDILFLGELYRSDSTALRLALDSMLTANNIDTTILFASAREIVVDKQKSAELYRIVIERFEKQSARPDTLDAKEKATRDSLSTPIKPKAPYLTGKE
ncbi:MAG: hypothetical protein IH600_14155 [Bacteroidetes bacterium]|nr:hypothetical protein [Bacteroidota bacterium]